jgi:sulfur carrier protein ThiS
MKKIEIGIFGIFSDDLPDRYRGKTVFMSDEPNLTIYDLIRNTFKLKIEDVIVMVNGMFLTEDVVLKDGDRLNIFPPVAGG